MNFTIKFVDINDKFIKVFADKFKNIPGFLFETVDVCKYVNQDNVAFVSPANSIGFMDGGIDLAYSQKMFLTIESKVKKTYAEHGKMTRRNRPYMPIGSAVVISTDNKKAQNQYLVCAPTMWLPHNVVHTDNAFYAFYAILCAVKKSGIKIDTLICSPFCTGYGKMSAEQSADQMFDAYNFFLENGIINDHSSSNNVYFNEPNKDQQPRILENYEFF